MPKWKEGQVRALRRWTDVLYSVQLEVDNVPFTAGQFARLALEIEGEMVARPYSFVNGPDEPLHEFYFVSIPNGPLTQRLVLLQPGDALSIAPRGAGFFILDEVPVAKTLWMLSTGTGIGPFLSMLKTSQAWSGFQQIVLIHAVRKCEELNYSDEIQQHRVNHQGQFQYIPFVSQEQAEAAMPGRVPLAIEDGTLEARAGLSLDAESAQVMICGNPAMVRDTQAVLEARGMVKNRRKQPGQITTEQYWKV